MGDRGKKLDRNRYERLHRQYCRRYGLNPYTTHVPKSELIADAVFVRKEAQGEYPADRLETVLSAIFHCVFWSACYHGMKPGNAEKYIGEAEVVKPKRWKEPTKEERRKQAEAADRSLFARIRDKFRKENR